MKSPFIKCVCFFIIFASFAAIFVFAVIMKNRSNDSNDTKIIETKSGKIRGVRETTLIKNMNFYSFKGIPYAKPPIGELRFKSPQPVDPWPLTEFDATKHGSSCLRPNRSTLHNQDQDENCLFLNVYVPADVNSNEKLAVLVFIHGGTFSEGSGNDDHYGPDFIIEQNAILVTFNYRFGVLGFLSLNSPEYSGNMGLKDQQLALKWVHSNIESFMGDNRKIMLFGESAGAAMTHLHMLSSESRQYFSNAVLLSGSAENFWAFSEKNDHTDLAYKIANDLGKPKHSFEDLVDFLKTVPAEDIIGYGTIYPRLRRTTRFMLSPVIERKDAVRPFIVDWPSKIYNQTNIGVDAMFGFCSLEEMPFYRSSFEEIHDIKGLDQNFTLRLPFREAKLSHDSPEYQKIMADIREYYFKNATIDEKSLKQYIEMLSDINFSYGIDKSAKMHAAEGKARTFYYRFSVDSKLNVIKQQNTEITTLPGAGHADDLCYIFRCSYVQNVYDEIVRTKDEHDSKISLKTIDNITKLLTNFAKDGDPTDDEDPVVGFLPILKNHVHFLDITNDGLFPKFNPNQKANEFWAEIDHRIQQINAEISKSALKKTLDF